MKTLLAAMAMGAALAACSAGGTDPTKTTTPPTTTPSAAALSISPSKTSVTSSGSDTALITVTAVDAKNNVVASAPITFQSDGGVLTTSGATTNSSGVATATLSIGTDHTNRAINVLVKSGSITKTQTIQVTGDTLTATVTSTTAGSAASIKYTLLDAGSQPIANQAITVTMAGQADVAGVTDVNGKYEYDYTMPSASTTVTATAANVATTSTVTPTNGTTVIPDAAAVTSASLAANPTSVSTGKQAELRALFIGASNAPIQYVRVHFMMDDSNSIGGALSTDASNGTHNVVYSDANGVARSTYTAGTRGGVITPKICWSSVDFTTADCTGANEHMAAASSLTVVASGVSLAVFTNGTISVDNTKNVYTMSVIVQVVDASNQPISGSTVTGAVDIPRFYRGIYGRGVKQWGQGIYVRSGSPGAYTYLPSATNATEACDNEDVNRNNILESGEDPNNSGTLEPFKASVTIVPTSAGSNVTDSFGKAYFLLQYGQNYASWEDVVMSFSTSVEGTEGHATYPSTLPVPSDALTNLTSTPPFFVSPFNVPNDNAIDTPWIVGTTPVTNPGVIYPATTTFNLCKEQK
ncbi:MAG: Ig-like domain-containing protein [Vitreoscilla sp.]